MEEVLVVRLIEARDLCPRQRASLSHPFVKITFGSASFKSKTVKKSLNPHYDEIFLFNIPKHISRARPPDMSIECFSSTNFLGKASVSLQEAFTKSAQDKWYMLSGEDIDKGYFRLQFMVFANSVGIKDESAVGRSRQKKLKASEIEMVRKSLADSLQSTIGSSTETWSIDELGYPVPPELQHMSRHMSSLGRCEQSRQLDRWIAQEGAEAVQPEKHLPSIVSELFWNGIPKPLRAKVFQKMEPAITKQWPSVIFLLAQPNTSKPVPQVAPRAASSPSPPSSFLKRPRPRPLSQLTPSMRLFRKPRRTRNAEPVVFRGSSVDCRSKYYRELLCRANLFTSAAFPGLEEVVNKKDGGELDQSTKMQIEKDLTRTFPPGFKSPVVTRGDAMKALQRVLSAYAIHNKRVGYCQSLNLISGFYLCQFEEETAFWILVILVEHRLPDYYGERMEGLLADFMALEELLSTRLPKLMDFMQSIGVSAEVLAPYYLMTSFVMSVPSATAIRIMDLVICVGSQVLLLVMVAFLRRLQPILLNVDGFPDFIETFKKHLRECFDAQTLINQVLAEFSLCDTPTNELDRITKLRERCLRQVRQNNAEEDRTKKMVQHFKKLMVPSARFDEVSYVNPTEEQRRKIDKQNRLEGSIKLPGFLCTNTIRPEWKRLTSLAQSVLEDSLDDPAPDLRSLSRAQFAAVCEAIQEKIQPDFKIQQTYTGDESNTVAKLSELLHSKNLDAPTARVDFYAFLSETFFRLHFWSTLLPRSGSNSSSNQHKRWPPSDTKEVQTTPLQRAPSPEMLTPEKRRPPSFDAGVFESGASPSRMANKSKNKKSFWRRLSPFSRSTPDSAETPTRRAPSGSNSSAGSMSSVSSSSHSGIPLHHRPTMAQQTAKDKTKSSNATTAEDECAALKAKVAELEGQLVVKKLQVAELKTENERLAHEIRIGKRE